MAKTFRLWDVDQGWLLPPSVHEFVPPDHLAAWQVRAYRDGRRGTAYSFASREEALAYAWSLGRIITQSTNISGLQIKLIPIKEPELPWGYRQAPGA